MLNLNNNDSVVLVPFAHKSMLDDEMLLKTTPSFVDKSAQILELIRTSQYQSASKMGGTAVVSYPK